MTIYEQILEFLKNKEIGQKVTSTEVKQGLKKRYGTNVKSILLSDYCYNLINDGIRFNIHIFEYCGKNNYKYLGENYPYTGKVIHKPLKQVSKVVGEWINGSSNMYPTEK